MSIIIAKKEKDCIWIGADSQETSGETTQENFEESKLRLVEDGIYVGMVGDGHVGSLLYAYLEENSLKDVVSSIKLIDFFKDFYEWSDGYMRDEQDKTAAMNMSQFIIVNHGEIWYFNNYYTRKLRTGEVSALGSGRQAALTAMHLGHSIEEALQAVCKVDIYCSEPITLYKIDTK